MQAKGYVTHLMDGWRLSVSILGGKTVAWLTNTNLETGYYDLSLPDELLIDLHRQGYVPTVYHEGDDTPPLVVFHAAQPDAPRYVWVPRQECIDRVEEHDHA